MHINEQYHDLPLLETKAYQFIGRDGQNFSTEEQVLNEHLLDVYINDRLTMKLICLPQHLTELVLGRLLTEHIIRSVDDIEQIYICEYGNAPKSISARPRIKSPEPWGLPLWRPLPPAAPETISSTIIFPRTIHRFRLLRSNGSLNGSSIWLILLPMECLFTVLPLPRTAVFSPEKMRFFFPVKTSAGTTPSTK